tara:strand:- start:94 stop:684 length:591 start_codon:yes stop_codon:yes gene_type:complete
MLRITEKSLRKMIKSALNELDSSSEQNFDMDYLDKKYPPQKSGLGLNSIKQSLDDMKSGEKKPNIPTVFKRKFTVNPISAIQYFKDILSKDQSEFMNFMHVFLDFMLNLNDSLHNDRENFKSNYEQLIPIFIQFLRQHQSQGNYISQDLVHELGVFFRFLGQKLTQVNFGDSGFHEEDQSEEKDYFRETRIRRRRR